jgi:hypothetical protein
VAGVAEWRRSLKEDPAGGTMMPASPLNGFHEDRRGLRSTARLNRGEIAERHGAKARRERKSRRDSRGSPENEITVVVRREISIGDDDLSRRAMPVAR